MKALFDRLRGYYLAKPARSFSFLAAVVVFVAAKAGLVLPEASVAQALSAVLPIVTCGQLIHDRVSPAKALVALEPIVGHAVGLDTNEIARRIAAAVKAETTTEPGTPPTPVAGSMGR